MSEEKSRVSLARANDAAAAPVHPAVPGPGEHGYVPPVSAVPLPSKGKAYPPESPLFQAESVEIKSMSAREENILASKALLRSGRALGTLIQACVVDRSIDTEQMFVGDRNALLVAIRITGYGSEYPVEITCPECDKKFNHEFDLSKLEIKPLGAEPAQLGVNSFEFELPVTKKRCCFKLLTGADERERSATQERRVKLLGPAAAEGEVTGKLCSQVTQVGDVKDPERLKSIIENLPAKDSLRLRKYIEKVEPDVKMSQAVECKHCGTESEVPVPFGTEFFWPDI